MADYGSNGGDLTLQPNTLLPYSPMPTLPVAQAPEPMAALPVADIAPTQSPWQTVARMLQGFQAGALGRPNPVILLEQQQQRLQQAAQSQQLQQQQFERLMKKDDESLKIQKEQMSQTLGLKLIDSADPELREQGYRLLQQGGGLDPRADPAKLSILGKIDYNQRRDEAISMIESGIDPAELGGQYAFLPLDQYKKMHAGNPLALNPLRSKPQSAEQVAIGLLLRIMAMDPAAVKASPSLQRQITAAQAILGSTAKVNYGEGVNAALGTITNPQTGMPFKPTDAIPPEVMAQALRIAQTEKGPPTLERKLEEKFDLEQQIANPESPEAFRTAKAKLARVNEQIASLRAEKRQGQVISREDIEEQLTMQGLVPGTPAFKTAYNNMVIRTALPQGGMLVGGGNIGAGLGPTGMGTGMQAAPPMAAAPIGPAELAKYVHKTTLQPPPAGSTAQQIQASGDYVPVPEGALQAVRQFKTVANLFGEAERIIKNRGDLFPESKDNVLLDRANVAYSQAKWALGAKTDPDIGTMESLMIALPTLVKAFGDTGNIAVAERLQASAATGFSASTQENALARIKSIRSLTSAGATAMGFPNIIKDLNGPGTKQERIKQLIRDGKSDAEIKATLKQEGFDR